MIGLGISDIGNNIIERGKDAFEDVITIAVELEVIRISTDGFMDFVWDCIVCHHNEDEDKALQDWLELHVLLQDWAKEDESNSSENLGSIFGKVFGGIAKVFKPSQKLRLATQITGGKVASTKVMRAVFHGAHALGDASDYLAKNPKIMSLMDDSFKAIVAAGTGDYKTAFATAMNQVKAQVGADKFNPQVEAAIKTALGENFHKFFSKKDISIVVLLHTIACMHIMQLSSVFKHDDNYFIRF